MASQRGKKDIVFGYMKAIGTHGRVDPS